MFIRHLLLAALVLIVPQVARALDAFDRHALAHLRQATKEVTPLAELTQRQAAGLKLLGPGILSPCIVVQTDAGNWVKALVSWGLRKGEEKPVPVLLFERYVTYDSGRPGLTAASGKDVMLFGGFAYDFDIGQVVPAGQGGDIEFTAERAIRPTEKARLFTLDGPALPPQSDATAPDHNDHEGVLPRDFAGAWRLNADGRWLGTLELEADDQGNLSGQYLSDGTQSYYPVIGKIDPGSHRAVFEVQLVNSGQLYEAFLWTTDKSTMAGNTTLADREFGFYALRHKPEATEGDAATP